MARSGETAGSGKPASPAKRHGNTSKNKKLTPAASRNGRSGGNKKKAADVEMTSGRLSAAGEGASLGLAGIVLLAQVVLLACLQGGFFGAPVCLCGIVSWVSVAGLGLSGRARKGFGAVPALFCVLALCYALSLFVNGFNLTGASETATWFAIAGASALAFQLAPHQRMTLFSGLAGFGAVYALAGIVAFVVFPDGGWVHNDRLDMSFEYANALAAFLAICFWLGVCSPFRWVRVASVLPLIALALTQSGGAAVALCASAIVFAAWRCARQRRILPQVAASVRAVLGAVLSAGLVALAGVLAAVLLPGRVDAALQSFAERMIQMHDGLGLLLGRPLLGIGPDAWQFVYPYIQTAQYRVSVVHFSVLQIALDAGLLGLAALVAVVVLGVRSQLTSNGRRSDVTAALFALVFLCIHSSLDFDLQFGAIALVFALLITDPEGAVPAWCRRGFMSATSVAGALLCLLGILAGVPSNTMAAAIRAGNPDEAAVYFESNGIVQSDIPLQTRYLQATAQLGDEAAVEAWTDAHGAPTDEQALIVYQVYYASGQTEQAAQILLDALESQPYNLMFYQAAQKVVTQQPLPTAQQQRFEQDVAAFNERATQATQTGVLAQYQL